MQNRMEKTTILVVDDEYTTHRIIDVILRGKNCTILSAYNGLEALELLKQAPVDMILTDVNMPYMDGIALIECLRSDANHKSLPIVVITASPLPQVPVEALEKGATAYISQPFSSWELARVVSDILGEKNQPAGYNRPAAAFASS